MCGSDRVLRAVLGGFLLSVLVRSAGRRGAEDRSIGLRELLTASAIAELSVTVFAQWCAVNALLGIDTCHDY